MNARAALALVLVAAAAVNPASAQSVGVQVTPVIITIPSGRTVTSLRVNNRRDRESAFEAIVYVWDQENGEDALSVAENVVVAPSTFVISPQGQQIVRLALTPSSRDALRERTYRLIVRELPPQEAAPGLRVQLQLSMPVFVAPASVTHGLTVRRAADGITLVNVGNAHIRLSSVTAQPDGGAIGSIPRYLLAGEQVVLRTPAHTQALDVLYAAADEPAPVTQRLNLESAGDLPR